MIIPWNPEMRVCAVSYTASLNIANEMHIIIHRAIRLIMPESSYQFCIGLPPLPDGVIILPSQRKLSSVN